MPIGFWAVSRGDVHQMLALKLKDYKRNRQPDPQEVDNIVRQLPSILEEALDNTVTSYVTEHPY
jgi:hypothetical protein